MFDSVNRYKIDRLKAWHLVILIIFSIFFVRLFYLQIIKHSYYKNIALKTQLKEYEIPAERGIIEAHDHDSIVPIVLNEKQYTLFADPKFIKDASETSKKIASVVGGNASDYEAKMKVSGRYSILAKKLNKNQQLAVNLLKLKGIGTREEEYRTYPQGSLASQLLGFVNDEGKGNYGIEQFLDESLRGRAGQLRAITDVKGVPLVSNKDNIVDPPISGQKVLLTIDVSMQRQLEDILKSGLERVKSNSGSAIIMNPNDGSIKAMANYPSYDPSQYSKVEDSALFTNAVASSPLEVGSSMKPLMVAAGLDRGVINENTTYYDPSFVVVDGIKVTNIEEDGGAGTRSIKDILQLSLNTGAVHVLAQMGGGTVNQQARLAWYDYMHNHFRFGQLTNVEQGYESEGSVPDPQRGYGLNIQYANTSFGQGLSITPLQMAAAFSSVVNGGTYFRPRLVDRLTSDKNKVIDKRPEIIREQAIKSDASTQIRNLMIYSFSKNYPVYGMKTLRDQFNIGGKTGTAQISNPLGGYYSDRFNGTFAGFVGGDKPQYVIFVRVNEPKIAGYAGSKAAAPIFVSLTNMLIDNFGVTPKSH